MPSIRKQRNLETNDWLNSKRLQCSIEKGTDQDKIEERGLVDLDEIGVPGFEIVLGGFVFGIRGLDVLLAVLDHLRQDLARHVRQRDAAVGAVVLDHVLYRLRLQRHRLVHLESLAVRTLQCDLLRRRHDDWLIIIRFRFASKRQSYKP